MAALTTEERQYYKDLEDSSKALIERMEKLLKEAYKLLEEK